MCGIALTYRQDGPATPMDLQQIAHRGPDARGSVRLMDGHLWIGHTRLAIQDLSEAGSQPMQNSSSGDWIIFNGEIYNHLELRSTIGTCQWVGSSDTETLLKAYERWGIGMLPRIRGMFAFVLFDAKSSQLIVARDRLGIKPLYWIRPTHTELSFCSEVRPLYSASEKQMTAQALSAYLRHGACHESHMPDAQLHMFPAGCYCQIDLSDSSHLAASPMSFWNPKPSNPVQHFKSPVSDPIQGVRELLDAAVAEHMISDVPVASFLSGGIDSSIISLLAARHMTQPLDTFTVCLPGTDLDESSIAEQVADRIGSIHHRIEVTEQEALTYVENAVEAMDLPSVDAINSYLVCQKVADAGIKVALSGLGGDELFGGYPSFEDVPRLLRYHHIPRQMFGILGSVDARFKRLADMPVGNGWKQVRALTHWRRYFRTHAELIKTGLSALPAEPELQAALFDDFSEISWAEISGYMRHILLRDSDQMSMAVSLELRVPFLDHRFVEYVLALPEAAKKKYPWKKGLLVEAFREELPREVYDRKKQGFELPMAKWMQGPLESYCQTGLLFLRERMPRLESLVQTSTKQFSTGKIHWTRLWALVVLGHYAEKHHYSR